MSRLPSPNGPQAEAHNSYVLVTDAEHSRGPVKCIKPFIEKDTAPAGPIEATSGKVAD